MYLLLAFPWCDPVLSMSLFLANYFSSMLPSSLLAEIAAFVLALALFKIMSPLVCFDQNPCFSGGFFSFKHAKAGTFT